MKHLRFLFALIAVWTTGAIGTFAAVGDTFNYTYEGVMLAYQVLSDDDMTCAVIPQADEDLLEVARKAQSVVIPETVTYDGSTYTVTEIGGRYAFNGFTMTTVTLPETLKKIGFRTFYDCNGLTTVTIPEGFYFDSTQKFYGCFNLKDVYVKARDYNVYKDGNGNYGSILASFDNCAKDLTFHVSGCIYQQVQYGSKSGSVFSDQEEDKELLGSRIVLDENWTPRVGDMTIVEVPVVNSEGTQVGTRKVFFTFTNVTEGHREAIIYRPAMGNTYDPATCWIEGGSKLYEEAMMPLTDTDVAGTLMLPTSVTDIKGNTYSVTGIGAHGFATNGSVYVSGLGYVTGSYLSGIYIPKGYTRIGVQGLKGLDKLSGDLIIPSTVVQMGDASVEDGQVFPTNQGTASCVRRLYILNNDAEYFNWYQTSSDEFYSQSYNNYQYRPTLHVSPALLDKFRNDTSSGIGAWNINPDRYVEEFLPLSFKKVNEYGEETMISTYTVYEAGEYEVMFDNLLHLPVTFNSSNPDIARIVPGQDGYCNIVVGDDIGQTEITASSTGNDICGEVTTTLTVTHKGPAELGSQENENAKNTVQALQGLTKITFDMNDLAIIEGYYADFVELDDESGLSSWYAATLHNNQVYASAYATIDEDYSNLYIDQEKSEGYYSNYGSESGFRLSYNPSLLTPNWGANITNPEAGDNVGGMLCFLVPKGQGTIIVKGYTDSENAKMGIRLGLDSAEPMVMAVGQMDEYDNISPKEFIYEYNNTSNAPAWVYIYGISLKPEYDYYGHIESITYVPEGAQLAKLLIAGEAVAEGSTYTKNGVSVTWESLGGGIGGGDSEGGDEGDSSLVPVITLNNVNLTSTTGPAIEVNSYDGARIQLKGSNKVSSISVGTMNGQDWEGCRILIAADEDDAEASLTIPASASAGFYNYNSYVDMSGFTGSISGQQYGILLTGDGQGEGYRYFTLEEGLSLELRGDASAFRSEILSYNDIDYDACPLLAWEPKLNDEDYCEYDYYEEGQFMVSYEDEDTGEYTAEPATYLRFGPPYFIAKTPEGVAMKFEVIDEDEKTCLVYGAWSGSRVTAISSDYEGPVTIPETVTYEGTTYTVTSIANYAFNYCHLTTLTIPKTVESVRYEALDDCSSLTRINCYATEPPTLDTHYSISSNTTLYVPEGTKEDYLESDWGTKWYFDYGERIVEMEIIEAGDGDANGDGDVDINDVVEVVNCILGQPSDNFDEKAADVNGDGFITIADVVMILDIIVKDNASGNE